MPAISGWKWGQSDNPATAQKITFELCYNWTLAANIHNVQVIRA